MRNDVLPRRYFLLNIGLAAGAAAAGGLATPLRADRDGSRFHLASNAYSWHVFYQREGRDFNADLETSLADVAASDVDGFEPGIGSVEDLSRLVPLLKKHGLGMRSIYVNSTLHAEEDARKSIAQILAVARAAKAAGTRIIVTNPNPIRWGGQENKDDAQLRVQASAMETLGRELSAMGLALAYHNHDIELRNAAREFHHMMAGIDPRLVGLCLDAHWIYRGSGNSSVALFDIVRLYGSRVKELHLRQSRDGVWSEMFGPGDIDYEELARALKRAKARPHVVLEVAVEKGTPKTMIPVEAHRQSAAYVRRVFAGLAAR